MHTADVELDKDSVTISVDGEELVKWVQQEWEDDPTIVPAIVHAALLAATDPVKMLELLAQEEE